MYSRRIARPNNQKIEDSLNFQSPFVFHQDRTYLQARPGAAGLFPGTGLAFSARVVKISGSRSAGTLHAMRPI
jgi:hypothetical protein